MRKSTGWVVGLVVSLSAWGVAHAGTPFLVQVNGAANADGTVTITVKGNADWRGTVTVRDEAGRLMAIVSQNPTNKYGATQDVAFAWDGKDYEGQAVPAGKYAIRVEGVAINPAQVYDPGYGTCYSYLRFDSLERSIFMTGYNFMEEPPWTMDCTLPERYARRMDFSGLPLGPVIPFDNVMWNHQLLNVDLHDNLYVPGSSYEAPQPYRLLKINGRTGQVLWNRVTLPPPEANPQQWAPEKHLAGLLPTAGATALWDTDENFYCGSMTRYFFHVDGQTGKWLAPPIKCGLDLTWKRRVPDLPVQCYFGYFWIGYIGVAPNGDVISPTHSCSASHLVRMRPDGTPVWLLSSKRQTPPRAPENAGANYGGGTHDNASIVCDVANNVYRAGGTALVKFDQYGQLLLEAAVFPEPTRVIGDMDLSADGHMLLCNEMHTWGARIHQLDWAEAAVQVSGKAQAEKGKGQGAKAGADLPEVKPAGFLISQTIAADWLNLGRWQLANKEYEKALKALEQAVKESKDQDYLAVALVNIARAYQRQGQWEKELATYERLAQEAPGESGWANLQAALLEKENGKAAAALTRLAAAAEKEQDVYLKAKLLLQLAQWQPPAAGIETYRQVADSYRFARGNGLIGLLPGLVAEKKWAEAEPVARELILEYPNVYAGSAANYWPQIRAGQGQTAEAAPVLKMEGSPGTAGDLVADFALGQDNSGAHRYPVDGVAGNNWCYMSQPDTFGWPIGIEILNGKLWVADSCKGRLAAYDLPVSKNRPSESLVVGYRPEKEIGTTAYWVWPQNNMGAGGGPMLWIPWGLATDGKRFYVSSHAANKVVVLDAAVAAKDTKYLPAQPLLVLGQQKAEGCGYNGKSVFAGDIDKPSAWSMHLPCAISCDGQRLVVADCGNHRVLIWTTLPEKTGQPADLVLGQKDFTTAARSRKGAAGLNRPRGVFTDGQRLFVADTMNHRVLVWKTFPKRNAQPADVVLGVPDFETEGEWPITTDGRIGPDTMSYPHDVYYDGKSLYVCDGANNRIMIWDKFPEKNGQPCDRYIGMPGPGFGLVQGWRPGYGGGFGALCFPMAVRTDEKAIYVSDTWQNKVLVYLK